eukprot:TRINITY_DN5856_c0_g1_i1.p1 TRINITY_DN5856_c0_g1~~TRINITY_DN5856_c0_g1_i1.p1  ORF type:complete len:124 (+),score=52.73 TRINITY_DN5856_c0_g1_i1:179-550(+)
MEIETANNKCMAMDKFIDDDLKITISSSIAKQYLESLGHLKRYRRQQAQYRHVISERDFWIQNYSTAINDVKRQSEQCQAFQQRNRGGRRKKTGKMIELQIARKKKKYRLRGRSSETAKAHRG